MRRTVTEFEKRSRELVATIQDRSERLKVEREAQRRVAELKREAQRAAAVREARTDFCRRASTASRRAGRARRKCCSPESRPALLKTGRLRTDREHYVAAPGREIAVGDKVKLRSFGSIGIVDSIKSDEAEVRVKSLRLREKLENLELVEAVAPVKTQWTIFEVARHERHGNSTESRTDNYCVGTKRDRSDERMKQLTRSTSFSMRRRWPVPASCELFTVTAPAHCVAPLVNC